MEWSEQTLVNYRMHRCRKWLKRAQELEGAEKLDAASRPEHVRAATSGKRLVLTQKILDSMSYEDKDVLELLKFGSPLAGEIPKCEAFEELLKPCMLTMAQLLREAPKRNQAILATCKSTGDLNVDRQLLQETRDELAKGWAVGPFADVPERCVLSRRFAVVQKNKTRMIDDYTISGINDTAAAQNKVDLHMVDTFAAVVREFFRRCGEEARASHLLAKTYDLKSAYRQVPIAEEHLRFSFSCICNCELGRAEVYQLTTLPFGATHSVYSFLRLARMLYTICTRSLFLLTTNFYDDYILASLAQSVESAKNSMELVFMLTGWNFDRDGKKAPNFGTVCNALGVQFDLSSSGEKILMVRNTEQRVQDLQVLIAETLGAGVLAKQDALVLRGKLGFADLFLHGRLGLMVLQQLSDHAYGRTNKISEELNLGLRVMSQRLAAPTPRVVPAKAIQQWFLFVDAAYEPETVSGGLGAALFSEECECLGWFGLPLDKQQCLRFGAGSKQTIIYELEMLAAILGFDFWVDRMKDGLQVCYGDNDGARFSLIRGSCMSPGASALMRYHLEREAVNNLCTWYARVPTEANVGDFPSRHVPHPLLPEVSDESAAAMVWLDNLTSVALAHAE